MFRLLLLCHHLGDGELRQVKIRNSLPVWTDWPAELNGLDAATAWHRLDLEYGLSPAKLMAQYRSEDKHD